MSTNPDTPKIRIKKQTPQSYSIRLSGDLSKRIDHYRQLLIERNRLQMENGKILSIRVNVSQIVNSLIDRCLLITAAILPS